MPFQRRGFKKRNPSLRPIIEAVEPRVLLSAIPPVISFSSADSRGGIILNVSEPLVPSTVNANSVLVYTAGPDGILGTADDKKVSAGVSYGGAGNQILIDSNIPIGTAYRVDLVSSLITGTNGLHLDGEFNGAGVPSGDGTAGGDYQFETTALGPSELPTADFITSYGGIVVPLSAATPLTDANFEAYANNGTWDGTFFTRAQDASTDGIGIIQGGGYYVAGPADPVTALAPVQSEVNDPATSNVADTIAMALPSDSSGNTEVNDGTDEWFFNVVDNSSPLDDDFTAFGKAADPASVAVINAIGALPEADLTPDESTPFNNVPIADPSSFNRRGPGDLIPNDDFVTISQIAMAVDEAPLPVNLGSHITGALPVSLVIGQSNALSTTVTIQNTGSSYSGDLTIQLLASPDRNLGDAQSVSTFTKDIVLAPGASTSVSVPIGALNGLVNGNYTLFPEIVPVGTATNTASPSASAKTITASVASFDLVETVSTTTKLINAGKTVSVSVKITNRGNVRVAGSIPIQFASNASNASNSTNENNSTLLGSTVNAAVNLLPGASQTFNYTLTIPAATATGNYFIMATLETDSLLHEIDPIMFSSSTIAVLH